MRSHEMVSMESARGTLPILRALADAAQPTTVPTGTGGCEIPAMAGLAQQDSPEAAVLIERATEVPSTRS